MEREGRSADRRVPVTGTQSRDTDRLMLVWPSREYLSGSVAALERGWSPDLRREVAAREQLAAIAADPDAFLASLVDVEGRRRSDRPPQRHDRPALARLSPLAVGRRVLRRDRIPLAARNARRCRRRASATSAMRSCRGSSVAAMRHERWRKCSATRGRGGSPTPRSRRRSRTLPSQRVIEANGGVLHEEFVTVPALGSRRERRYRIDLPPPVVSGFSRTASARRSVRLQPDRRPLARSVRLQPDLPSARL